MTAPTPGQALYEVISGRFADDDDITDWSEWGELEDSAREVYEDAGQAAIVADPEVRAFHRLVAEIAGYAAGEGMAHGALGEIQGKARTLLFGDTPVSGRCPGGCGCRLGTDDAERRECGCVGPCATGRDARAEGIDQHNLKEHGSDNRN
jgi:hypothetical protein